VVVIIEVEEKKKVFEEKQEIFKLSPTKLNGMTIGK
jgi:hypothetical protein